jgi:hypothetical protein
MILVWKHLSRAFNVNLLGYQRNHNHNPHQLCEREYGIRTAMRERMEYGGKERRIEKKFISLERDQVKSRARVSFLWEN